MSEIGFDEVLDISRVGALYDQLNPLLKESSPSISLDLSGITHVDCAGIQLIYAFVQSARNQGVEIIFKQPSAALLNAANLIGLAGYFSPVK